MTRILYGVNGEGFGHSTRSIEIINFLVKQGHQVKVVSFGRGEENLREHFSVEKIFGLRFVYQENEVRYLKTIFKNLMNTPEAVRSLSILKDLCETFQPQLVISDFEPLTAAIAHLRKLPLLSIDNEHVLTKTKYDSPEGYHNERQVALLITRLMVWRAKAYIALSFFACQPTAGKVYVLPPVIRQAVLNLRPEPQDYVIVYLNNEFEGLIETLRRVDCRFVVYGFDCHKQSDNLLFKKFNQHEFLSDLSGAKAVIGTAGFSLISESLYLGKPYFALPAGKQFEQALNAYHVKKLGYGECHDEITPVLVGDFLHRLPDYNNALRGGIASGNEAVFDKLEQLIRRYARS